jgi:hypothetical protein
VLLQIRAAEDAKAKNGGMEGQLKSEKAEKSSCCLFDLFHSQLEDGIEVSLFCEFYEL